MNLRRLALAPALVLALLASAHAGDPKPMEKAKAGEWVLDKIVASGFTTFQYMWIAKVDGRKVTVNVQMLKEDGKTALMPPSSSLVDLDMKGPEPKKGEEPKVLKTSEEEVEIKGKKIKCTRTETEQDVVGSGRLVIVSWASNEIPISGIAKSVAKDKDGKVISETTCVDFGHEGGAEKSQK